MCKSCVKIRESCEDRWIVRGNKWIACRNHVKTSESEMKDSWMNRVKYNLTDNPTWDAFPNGKNSPVWKKRTLIIVLNNSGLHFPAWATVPRIASDFTTVCLEVIRFTNKSSLDAEKPQNTTSSVLKTPKLKLQKLQLYPVNATKCKCWRYFQEAISLRPLLSRKYGILA